MSVVRTAKGSVGARGYYLCSASDGVGLSDMNGTVQVVTKAAHPHFTGLELGCLRWQKVRTAAYHYKKCKLVKLIVARCSSFLRTSSAAVHTHTLCSQSGTQYGTYTPCTPIATLPRSYFILFGSCRT